MTRRYPRPLAFPRNPWTSLAQESAAVIGLRLWRVSLLWWTDPKAAERETRLMVSEKEDAAGETVQALMLSPWRFWTDMARAPMRSWPKVATRRDVDRAVAKTHEQLAAPSSRRVKANRRRLSRR